MEHYASYASASHPTSSTSGTSGTTSKNSRTRNLIYIIISSVSIFVLIGIFIYLIYNYTTNYCYSRNIVADLAIPLSLMIVSGYFLYVGISGSNLSLSWILGLTIPALLIIIGAILYNIYRPSKPSSYDCTTHNSPPRIPVQSYVQPEIGDINKAPF